MKWKYDLSKNKSHHHVPNLNPKPTKKADLGFVNIIIDDFIAADVSRLFT